MACSFLDVDLKCGNRFGCQTYMDLRISVTHLFLNPHSHPFISTSTLLYEHQGFYVFQLKNFNLFNTIWFPNYKGKTYTVISLINIC